MIRKFIHMLVATIMGMGFSSCNCLVQNKKTQENQIAIIQCDVAEFEKIIRSENVRLVDARTPEEYRQGNIAGALLIDVRSRDFVQTAQTKLNPGQPVAIYCRSGVRSMQAAKILVEKGLAKKIYNLKGGYTAYKAAKGL